MVEKKPARKRELNEVRGLIEERLLGKLRAEAQKAYVDGLRKKATVTVNDETLAQVSGRAMPAQSPEP